MYKTLLTCTIVVAVATLACEAEEPTALDQTNPISVDNGRRVIDLAAAPSIQRFVQDLSLADPQACDGFEILLSGTQTVTIKDFGDRLTIHVVRQAVHTNSVTGKSAKEREALTIIIDFVTGKVTWNGNVGNVTMPGEGIVLHRSGKLIFEGGEIIFAAGPHEVLLLENPGTLCEELA